MKNFDDMKLGWDFMATVLGADAASNMSYSDFCRKLDINNSIKSQNLNILKINEEIDKLAKSINEHPSLNLGVEQFKGFVAEEMHAGTFNIDAIRKASEHRAWTLQDNGFGSVDVDTNFGKQYSLKYSNSAKMAENMQSVLNNNGNPKYHGQERLIAYEQIEEAKNWARRHELKNFENRHNVSQSHKETGEHLVGKISDGNGVESKELSIKESKDIAREAKNGGFDPEKHGILKESLEDEIRIRYIDRALKAGLTAATVTAIVQILPEIYKSVDYLIKNGEIDVNGIKKSTSKVISGSGEAFLRGSIAYSVEMMIQNGVFGESIKGVTPTVVGVAVTVIMKSLKDSILVAGGKMDMSEMGMRFVDTMVISSGYLAATKIGGIIAQSLLPQIPVMGYALGSLLGCSMAVTYNIGKNKFISLCVNNGFTCFGLVEQDYEIPEEILKKMGVNTVDILRTDVSTVDIKRVKDKRIENRSRIETVDIVILKRGLIGVNKIGYVG